MASPDDYAKKTNQHLSNKLKLKILFLILLTNILTAYIFRNPSSAMSLVGLSHTETTITNTEQQHADPNGTSLSDDLQITQAHLQETRTRISELHEKLSTSNKMIQSLQDQLQSSQVTRSREEDGHNGDNSSGSELADVRSLPDEVKLSIGVQKLPLGRNPRAGSDEIYPSFGAACLRFKDELVQYLQYNVGGECPVDDDLVQRLMMKGCEPLPKRRCHPKSPKGYVDPTPYPKSLWSTPSDTSIVWDSYPCKSYQCLVDRRNQPGFPDCKDCFYLEGREKYRWLSDNGNLDYGIDQVLSTKPPGTIRIGVDIGGGTGSFAARMRERNITIVTTSMNFDGPFNSFISSRGLISMHVTISQRLPFFENTLDIVHSMHVLSNWIPDAVLEFTLFDIYRVLRPGGLFWLDRFFCYGSQLNQTYVPMIERVGFIKRRWNAGLKTDRGVKDEWYFSGLLEKPMS